MDAQTNSGSSLALILFGPPGSGKGTQAELLCAAINGIHLSTGDMLRAHIRAGDNIGQRAERLIKAGKLVPDELVNELVQQRLASDEAHCALILDGYPRTLNQAAILLQVLEQYGFRPVVVHLMVDHDRIVARLSGRRQCPVCKTLYNLITNPPKVAGICDRDGATLVTREDDREVVIRERLLEYDALTHPLLKYFRDMAVPVLEIDAGKASPDQIAHDLYSRLISEGFIQGTSLSGAAKPEAGVAP